MAIGVQVPVLVHVLQGPDLLVHVALQVRVLEGVAESPDVGAEGGELEPVHHSAHRNGALGLRLGGGRLAKSENVPPTPVLHKNCLSMFKCA